jgi:hypothetical protein
MNVITLMCAVTICYTITSLNDKYAVASAKLTGNEFTFLMCSSMSVFLAASLPFQEVRFTLSLPAFASVLLVALCKMLEFQMSALVLKALSAFELKAWLGVTLFASYLTDVAYGAQLRFSRLCCILVTVCGLILIARSEHEEKIEYRRILLPLFLYLLSKYGYGFVIKSFSPYVSPTMQLLPAMILLSLLLLKSVSPAQLFHKNRSAVCKVVLARIPNTIGMLLENAVIAVSLASYSFIQPMILVTLFLIGLLRREKQSRLNRLGSLICIAGIVSFQLV